MICLPVLRVLILEELAEAERHLVEQPEEAPPLPPLWTEKQGGESEDNPNVIIVQAILSARQGAAGEKRSLEADVATSMSGSVPKRPRRSCMLRPGKRCLNYLHVV